MDFPPDQAEVDVLHEQLDYLVTHARACRAECPECRRFDSAREALLRIWR